jgi:hypothetical protein
MIEVEVKRVGDGKSIQSQVSGVRYMEGSRKG